MKKKVLRTKQEVIEWFNSNSHSVLSFDTETNDSLNYYDLEILCFSCYNNQDAMAINLINNPEKEEIMNILKLVLNDVKVLIAHNIDFDLKVLRKYGIDLYNTKTELFCTYVADHLLDERRQHGLKYLAETQLGYDVKKYSEVKTKKGSKEYFDYAMNDAIWTYELSLLQKPQLKELGLERLFREIEMPFQFALVDMEINGFLVDKELILKTSSELKEAIQKFEIEMLDFLGEKYEMQFELFSTKAKLISKINFNSSQQLLKIFKKLGLEVTEKTKTGNLSVGKVTLKQYKDVPFVNSLSKYRIATKLLSAFFEPLPAYINGDGRVRAHFNDCGAKTGRLSCKEPGLQQLPKVNDDFPINTRKCFITQPGYKLITCDYSGQELRVLAEYTKDSQIIDIFKNGKDMHLANANKFLNLGIPEEYLFENNPNFKEYKKKFKKERDKSKAITFGVNYRKSAFGFAKDFKITEEEAQKLLDDYFALFPNLKKLMEENDKFIKENGYCVTKFFNRRRNFSKFIKDENNSYYTNGTFREGFNFLIQGYSADMTRMAINAMKRLSYDNPKWDLRIIGTIHDEALGECREEYAEECSLAIKKAFESVLSFCVPIQADVNYADNYGDAK